MAAAVAAATSRVQVGTWVLSALHRNAGITAKAVETIDEISGGRFVFGLGSGHAGRQAHAFGLPEDHVFGRFEEAVRIIVPLLREGRADFEGTFHAARDLEHRPVGPRPVGSRSSWAPRGRRCSNSLCGMPTCGAGTSRSAATSPSSARGLMRCSLRATRRAGIPRRSDARQASSWSPRRSQAQPTSSAFLYVARPRRSRTRSAPSATRIHPARGHALATHARSPRGDDAGASAPRARLITSAADGEPKVPLPRRLRAKLTRVSLGGDRLG